MRNLLCALLMLFSCAATANDEAGVLAELHARCLAAIQKGERPYFDFKLAAGRRTRAVAASQKELTVELDGNKLDVQWERLSDAEKLSLYRAAGNADSAGQYLLASILRMRGEFDAAQRCEERITDVEWAAKIDDLHQRFPSARAPRAIEVSAAKPAASSEAPPLKSNAAFGTGTRQAPQSAIGARPDAKQIKELVITRAGVYENLLIDGEFGPHSLVTIKAEDVVLRNCTIRNSRANGIQVYAKNVLIERCRISHLLNGTYKGQKDAHGITGAPIKLVVRDCDISYFSGDGLQFDPDRDWWDDVLVENCRIWTGPLPQDAGTFKKGERPGENAFDSKQRSKTGRSRVTLRNCDFHGFRNGQIDNMSALNIKERVDATVENCVIYDSFIGVRARGPGASGANATLRRCAFVDCDSAVRIEEKIENLKLLNLMFGTGIGTKIEQTDGGPGQGFEHAGDQPAPSLNELLEYLRGK